MPSALFGIVTPVPVKMKALPLISMPPALVERRLMPLVVPPPWKWFPVIDAPLAFSVTQVLVPEDASSNEHAWMASPWHGDATREEKALAVPLVKFSNVQPENNHPRPPGSLTAPVTSAENVQ